MPALGWQPLGSSCVPERWSFENKHYTGPTTEPDLELHRTTSDKLSIQKWGVLRTLLFEKTPSLKMVGGWWQDLILYPCDMCHQALLIWCSCSPVGGVFCYKLSCHQLLPFTSLFHGEERCLEPAQEDRRHSDVCRGPESIILPV